MPDIESDEHTYGRMPLTTISSAFFIPGTDLSTLYALFVLISVLDIPKMREKRQV